MGASLPDTPLIRPGEASRRGLTNAGNVRDRRDRRERRIAERDEEQRDQSRTFNLPAYQVPDHGRSRSFLAFPALPALVSPLREAGTARLSGHLS